MPTDDSTLRSLIRLIPPVRALKEQLEESLQLETYSGIGDFAVRSYQGLQAAIAQLATADPYLTALALTVPDAAADREKVSLALLASGQLLAYLEGQTGVASSSGRGGESNRTISINHGPCINMSAITGISTAGVDKLADLAAKALEMDDAAAPKDTSSSAS
jgi:hypothetical protein